MSPLSVLVTGKLPHTAQTRLDFLAESDEIALVQHTSSRAITREELLNDIKGMDGMLCFITDAVNEELLDAAGPQLKVISTMSVGYDHVDLDALTSRGIKLGHTPGVLSDAVAEASVALALMAARRLGSGIELVKSGEWSKCGWSATGALGTQLTEKTVGIVGLGRIGVAVARRMRPFIGGAPILYHSRTEHPEIATQLSPPAIFVPTLEQLLNSADVVFVCCSLTEKTRGLMDEIAFGHMKAGSIFVNTSRGSIVVTDALVKALQESWIGSAGIDVVDPEPISADHPLLKLSNCVIVPHIGSATTETREAMAHLAIDNLMAGLRGQGLKCSVN